MWSGARDGALAELTRHFLRQMARPPMLTEAGARSLNTVVAGVLAAVLAFGSWLPRVFAGRYSELSGLGSPEPYRRALLADELFLVSLAMLLAGLAVATLAHALFPDRTDLFVLGPLPVTRVTIFAAHLAALTIILGVFTVAIVAVLDVVFPIVSSGRWSGRPVLMRMGGLVLASASGAAFVYAAVVALQGAIGVIAPRGQVQRFTLGLQTVLVFGLVAMAPVLAYVPGLDAAIAAHPGGLTMVPPAWFVGLGRWAIGSGDLLAGALAWRAGVALSVALAAALAFNSVLYARFDAASIRGDASGGARRTPWSLGDASGMIAFIVATVGRSRLHRLVVFGVSATGLALVLNGLFGAAAGRWMGASRVSAVALQGVVTATPLLVVFASLLAWRTAFRLPVQTRARWIFRIAEVPERRPAQLRAADRVLRLCVLAPALLVAVAIQWPVLGPAGTTRSVAITWLLGLLLVQVTCVRDNRLPFTCTFLPGRLPFVGAFLGVGSAVAAFVTIGAGYIRWGLELSWPGFAVLAACLLAPTLVLASIRRRSRGQDPLEFDEQPADQLQIVTLAPY